MSAKGKSNDHGEFKILPIDKIRSSTLNPRQIFEKKPLEDLAESIKDDGLIEPIVVRPDGKKYEIVVGERRYRASKLAGQKTVPTLIRDLGDKKVLELMLIENALREGLEPIERAHTYDKLIKEHKYTQNTLALLVKRPSQRISEDLSLLTLPNDVQKHVVDSPKRITVKGAIPAHHAVEITRIKDPERQKKLAEKVIKKGSTQVEVRADVKKVKEIDKLVATVPSKKKRDVLKKDIESKLFEKETTVKKVKEKVEVAIKGFVKQPSFDDQWKSMKQGMKSIHDRYPKTSFVRGWQMGDRHFFQLVLWADKGAVIPTLVRKDYVKTDFATFDEADNHAKQHGGYCSGVILIRGVEHWCIFERENP